MVKYVDSYKKAPYRRVWFNEPVQSVIEEHLKDDKKLNSIRLQFCSG